MRTILMLIVLVAGVGLEAQRGGLSREDTKVIMAAFTRFVQDKSEVVADEAMLKRVIAGDTTLTAADMPKLWASGASSQYVKDFETVSKLREVILRIKSSDARRFGFVERIGDSRYTVIVYGPPDPARLKEWIEVEKKDPDFTPTYKALGGIRLPTPKPTRDAEGNLVPVFDVIQTEMMTKATETSVRKEFRFASGFY